MEPLSGARVVPAAGVATVALSAPPACASWTKTPSPATDTLVAGHMHESLEGFPCMCQCGSAPVSL
ncbi:hypothetical protein [Streptomyces sp. NPDC087859]|uniref:hypothetical protein n=1 Tax=Streptomyces sp. NPDC087859 TaxID=3365812 RepID=UPI00380421E9